MSQVFGQVAAPGRTEISANDAADQTNALRKVAREHEASERAKVLRKKALPK
jgi:hypothetical protein